MVVQEHQSDAKAFLLEIHHHLCQLYGCPVAFFHTHDPLSELVSSLLSHRTRNANSGKAFKNLKARFATWENVRDAPVAQVQAAIEPCTWPEQKAPRIQAILKEITARCGTLSLDFLKDMLVKEAETWLQSISGIGPKTSAAVLLFSSLRMRAMPVDSHHHRVAIRLGLIPAKTTEAKAHIILSDLLPEEWDAQHVYDHHEVMMFHGQRCCFFHNPNCKQCVLQHLCPTGQQRLRDNSSDSLSHSPPLS